MLCHINRCERTHNQLGRAGQHRNSGLSHTLQRITKNEYLPQKEVKQCRNVKIVFGRLDDFGIAVFDKYANHIFAHKTNQQRQKDAD